MHVTKYNIKNILEKINDYPSLPLITIQVDGGMYKLNVGEIDRGRVFFCQTDDSYRLPHQIFVRFVRGLEGGNLTRFKDQPVYAFSHSEQFLEEAQNQFEQIVQDFCDDRLMPLEDFYDDYMDGPQVIGDEMHPFDVCDQGDVPECNLPD